MGSGALSCCGEFASQATEAEYCAQHLPEYVRQLRLCFRYATILNLLFLLNDLRFYGQRHFYPAISARLLILLASLACHAAAAKVQGYRQYQFVCIAWTCPVIAASAVLVSPHTDIALLVTFILPAVFYLTVPGSFRLTLVFGVVCSACTLAAYLCAGPLSGTTFGLILGMLFSNAVFVLVLISSKRLRRLEWTATRAQQAANQELSQGRDMLQRILRAVPTPLFITAKESGEVIQANDAACEYLGTDLVNGSLHLRDHIDRRDLAKLTQKLQSEGQAAGFETRLRLRDGSIRDVLLQATTLTVAGSEAILTILLDITRRKEVEAIMERLANTDPLSGLANRARFFTIAAEEIERARRYKRPLAVFMVDIDYFKRINDSHGHNVGDLALKAFAELCRAWVRRQDVVARLGGEEFGLLLPETDAVSALALAERLRAAAEGLQVDKLPTPMTVSIGVSEVLPGESRVDPALSRADQALYAAKREGRNRVILYSQLESVSTSADARAAGQLASTIR